jgi:hypothetical protein
MREVSGAVHHLTELGEAALHGRADPAKGLLLQLPRDPQLQDLAANPVRWIGPVKVAPLQPEILVRERRQGGEPRIQIRGCRDCSAPASVGRRFVRHLGAVQHPQAPARESR